MEDFFMNHKERERDRIFSAVKSGSIKLTKAAELLNLSYPQTKRLWSDFKKYGSKGLISKRRGKKSNRAVTEEIKKEMAKIIADEFYDCKPLYVSEKLEEVYKFKYSSEFIRQLMIAHHLWIPKESKRNIHQRRQRRSCEGELVQVDASNHDWFEGRLVHNGKAIKAHLHILIDDATSTIYGGYFDYEETTNGYFQAAQPYFAKRGLPKALYCDKRGTFIVNSGEKKGLTQFARAMKELDIGMIFAHSPEAKGRVERAFGTLQERLVWEMRRLNISTLEGANEFLPRFFEQYNKRYAKKPANTFDAHRPLEHKRSLKYILCNKEQRMLSKNFEIQYKNSTYQVEIPRDLKMRIKKNKVNVITTLEGELQFEFEGEFLKYKRYEDLPYVSEKTDLLKIYKTKKKPYKPSKYHPWRNFNSSMKRAASIAVAFLSHFA